MAVSEDVMELVSLLDAEDFSVLAGELLTEIGLGREVETDSGEQKRIPIPIDEQLREALTILRLRLTEPARKLIEAEEIATRLNDGQPVSIIFSDPDEQTGEELRFRSRGAQNRDTKAIDALEAGLMRLAGGTDGAV